MRKILTIVISILLIVAGLSFLQSTDNNQKILGKWVSLDDEKYTMEFDGEYKTDFYNNTLITKEIFSFEEDKYLVVGEGDSKFKYEIIKLDKDNLEMIYLERGHILRFKKVK